MNLGVPVKMTDFQVYDTLRQEMQGVADIELPGLEYMTETVSGAGVMGEVDAPTPCQLGPMSLTINWRTLTDKAIGLLAPVEHSLGLYGAVQVNDPVLGGLRVQQIRVEVRGMTKSAGLGSFVSSAMMDSSTEMEVHAISVFIDGAPVLIIDKYAYICQIATNGVLVDYSASLRVSLGRG